MLLHYSGRGTGSSHLTWNTGNIVEQSWESREQLEKGERYLTKQKTLQWEMLQCFWLCVFLAQFVSYF